MGRKRKEYTTDNLLDEFNDRYDALCFHIIYQAFEDYMSLRGESYRMLYGKRSITRDELEGFFRSRWFGRLCDNLGIDGNYVVHKLYENERRKYGLTKQLPDGALPVPYS